MMMKPVTPYDFIAEFHKGSFCAIADLYREHHVQLHQFADQLIHHPQEAQDIVVDTFIKLMRRRMHFDNAINIKAFLYITVRNTCLGYLGYQQQQTKQAVPAAYTAHEELDDTHFEQASSRAEAVQNLYQVIEEMPSLTREVFKLLFVKNLLNTEVARQLGITAPEVLVQRTRALHLLQQKLVQQGNWSVPLLIYFLAIECPEEKTVEV
jgi:RNA polymerase sigma factor (sigma-70 family)